jgi:rhodanese-related sulfurtransferase
MKVLRARLRVWVLLGLIPLAGAFLNLLFNPNQVNWTEPGPVDGELELEVIRRWEQAFLWVDARDPALHARAHVPGAISLPPSIYEQALPALLERWEPGMALVVYCDSGACHASHEVASRLKQDMGLDDVWVLKGGWQAWQKAKRFE